MDEIHFIQSAPSGVLVAATKGVLDLNALAKEELALRGLDKGGNWVGVERAKDIHGVVPMHMSRRADG